MGVGYQGLQMALLAKRRKVNFKRTLTFGRQNHYLDAASLAAMFERFGIKLSAAETTEILADPYAEGLFRKLGASTVDSLDASDYEGATLIHDLNKPLPAELAGRYSCVIDFGLLEHVFNFPTALKSAVDLLEVGGYFISETTANNFLGHGFYQFSPELFFNYLSHNGFDQIEIFLIPYRHFPYFFNVADPRGIGGRVELVNHEPVLMGVLARKVKAIKEAVMPIQSDYYNDFWKGRDVNRGSQVPPVEPQLAAAAQDLKGRIAYLTSWAETVSPHLVHGFENHLHYQLMDPARD